MVIMDESRGKMDFVDSTMKLGSVVKINSISVDFSSSTEATESPGHEHFSLRGFVAGMRKKDLKKCFPFSSVGSDAVSEDNLPPLFIPEFRWWQCSSCIPIAQMKRTTDGEAVETKSDANMSSCENDGGKYQLFVHRRENIDASDMARLPKRPLYIVDEPDSTSSESDGTFIVLPHKRKPKLRSLADILVGERNKTSSNTRTRSVSSSGMPDIRTEMQAVLVPQREVDVPADVGKAVQSTERKRKTTLEEESEDTEPLVAICPSAAAKRLEDLVPNGENNSRRVELYDPKSKGGASLRLDLLKTKWVKPKKAKAIDSRKNIRRIHRDEEISKMREYHRPNAASSANLQEQALPMGGARSALSEIRHARVQMRPCFRKSLSRQQVEKIDDLSMARVPEVGADDYPFIHLNKSITGTRNIKGKVALDLSLDSFMDDEGNPIDQESFREHRCIPDLNTEILENTAITEGQQFTILSEKRSLPLHKKLDASSSCSTASVGEGKRKRGICEPKTKDNSNVEFGASDDIPMEIIELLARNQHDRSLGNSRKHQLRINNSRRGYSAVDVDEHPGTNTFPLPSRKNAFTVKNGNMGVGASTSTKFPQLNHCQLDASRPEKNHFRPLGSSTPSQPRKPEYSMSTSNLAGPRSGAESLWSSARENEPFHLIIPQNRPIQPCGIFAHSFSDQSHKGRTFCEKKDGKGKKAISNVAKLRDGKFIYPSIGSLDPYSNDTIPAMQLLSLMDQRVKSGSSFEVGTKSSQDKPFSPCKHHPRLNGKENHKFLHGSLLPQKRNSKDFSVLHYGVHSSGESSGRASSNFRVEVAHEVRNTETTLLMGCSKLEKQPAGSNEALGECTHNRNPADFSIPEVGNQFIITAKDLKPRRRNALKVKQAAENVDGRKRQRM